MRQKRIFALLCIVAMMLPLFCGYSVLAADDIIPYAEPAILADVGEKISLAEKKVELKDGTVLDGLTWTYEGEAITEFVPEDDVVYALKASKGDTSKNVYVVAKEKDATEYVLYFNDFDDADAISDWNKRSAASAFTIADGKLTANGLGANAIAFLPAWLGEFGNYRIDFVATQTDPTDTSRWISFPFRAKNPGGAGSPYYHMCVRKNMSMPGTSSTGGVECVSYSGGWTYYKSAGYTENIDPATFYKFSMLLKDSVCQFQIDDNVVIHLDKLPEINTDITGGIGIQANQSKLVIDSVKVTIQEEAPFFERPEVPRNLQIVERVDSNLLNTPTNVAIIESAEKMNALQTLDAKPTNAMFYLDGELNVTTKNGEKFGTIDDAIAAVGKNIIPAFYVKDKATVTAATAKLKEAKLLDVLFISEDGDVAKTAARANAIFRGAVDFTKLQGDKLSDSDLYNIRATTRKAQCLIAVIPAKFATQYNVNYLEELGLSVWVFDDALDSRTDAATYITSGAYGIVSNNHELVADCFTSLFVANTLTKTPIIIGHRGNPSQGPENSISNYLKAIENGAQVVETDIRPSKDGKVIVMHDDTMTRTTSYNGNTPVSQMTLEEIKQYYLWGDNDAYKSQYPEERVPTFEEMLVALKDTGVKIFVELKAGGSGFVKDVMDLIKKHGYEDRVFVISFSGSLLNYTQVHMPEMGTGFLTAIGQYETEEEMYNVIHSNILNFHGSYKSTYNPSYGNLSKELVEALRDRGITIWPWTFRNNGAESNYTTAFLSSVGGITTDYAQVSKTLVRYLDVDTAPVTLEVGGEAAITASAVKYSGDKVDISDDKSTKITFIEGEDVISFEDGKITALKDGTATFMVRYNVRNSIVGVYNLYSQPITVTVGASSETSNVDPAVSTDVSSPISNEIDTWIWVVIIGAVVGIIVVVTVVIIIRKKQGK